MCDVLHRACDGAIRGRTGRWDRTKSRPRAMVIIEVDVGKGQRRQGRRNIFPLALSRDKRHFVVIIQVLYKGRVNSGVVKRVKLWGAGVGTRAWVAGS